MKSDMLFEYEVVHHSISNDIAPISWEVQSFHDPQDGVRKRDVYRMFGIRIVTSATGVWVTSMMNCCHTVLFQVCFIPFFWHVHVFCSWLGMKAWDFCV